MDVQNAHVAEHELDFQVQTCDAVCVCRRVRVFWFGSGRLRRVYDESLEAAAELQRSDSTLAHLDPMDFGRRIAVEKELLADSAAPHQNALFDDSGNFVLFSTLLGIKVPPQSTPFVMEDSVRTQPSVARNAQLSFRHPYIHMHLYHISHVGILSTQAFYIAAVLFVSEPCPVLHLSLCISYNNVSKSLLSCT